MTRLSEMFRLRSVLAAAVVSGSLIGAAPRAHAGPAEAIHTPIIDYREWEFELGSGVQDWGNRENGEQAYKPEFGYGVAPRWFTEIEAEFVRLPGRAGRMEELEWENIVQLTEHGEYWLDAGIFAELSHNRLDNTNTLTAGPMLQKETQRTQVNLNVYFVRLLGALPEGADEEAGSRNEIQYQVQWKYNLHPQFQPGLQAFGSLGDPARLHSQELKVGPAFFGSVSLSNGKKLSYNAALLGGLTRETPNTTFRMQLEYEFF